MLACGGCGGEIGLAGGKRFFCNRCNGAIAKLARLATKEVRRAVARGELKKLPDGVTRCADCNAGAQCYDHRDYLRPLEVAPVCIGCNNRRGITAGLIGAFEHVHLPAMEGGC